METLYCILIYYIFITGIDEVMSFSNIMSFVQSQQFDIVLFDTAPTGHTLRLLSFPSLIQNAFNKLQAIKDKFGALIQTANSIAGSSINVDKLIDKLEKSRITIEQIHKQFIDPALTTFVCVCIPEFLSLYETERLVQTLTEYNIDTHNIVVNQVLMETADEQGKCKHCTSRIKMQSKYIQQIDVLYDEFHVVKMPQLNNEVRGVDDLNKFADLLVNGVNQDKLKSLLD